MAKYGVSYMLKKDRSLYGVTLFRKGRETSDSC